ncbi:MAG: NAD(P)/FAD-dependent oxidoreductase [Chordicoccus sp.]
MKNIVVIGGGAAGMMCAILASGPDTGITLIEKNEKLGKKLFITGKGRCNFTNACTEEEFLPNVMSNSKFLYSSIYGLNSKRVMELFEEWGMTVKVERGRRAFPASDHSSDVIDTLKRQLTKNHVRVLLDTEVSDIVCSEEETADAEAADERKHKRIPSRRAEGVRIRKDGREETIPADAVVVATGGISYPSTGSTGDGYRFARELGMKVTPLYPSLVPIACSEEYIKEMQGLSLKNVELHIRSGKKKLYDGFGEMMFTHFGITGPLVLSASAEIGPLIGKKEMTAWIDLKPAVSEEQLDARLVRIFSENPNKYLQSVLGELYPAKMVPVIPEVAGVDPETRLHDLTRKEREALIRATKHFPVSIVSLRGYNEAVITKGGVSVREIDPGTMESKKVRGLYFIGEVLDLDALTGGYNLQIAWCTAAACARAMTEEKSAQS